MQLLYSTETKTFEQKYCQCQHFIFSHFQFMQLLAAVLFLVVLYITLNHFSQHNMLVSMKCVSLLLRSPLVHVHVHVHAHVRVYACMCACMHTCACTCVLLDLLVIEWDEVISVENNNPNESFHYFFNIIDSLVNKYILPKKLTKHEIKSKCKPWITVGIRNSMKRRDNTIRNSLKQKMLMLKLNMKNYIKI